MDSNVSFEDNADVSFSQGSYEEMLHDQGSIVGKGLQGLATVAASGGNDFVIQQGAGELNASFRAPLHPGRNAVIDAHSPAKYIDDVN